MPILVHAAEMQASFANYQQFRLLQMPRSIADCHAFSHCS